MNPYSNIATGSVKLSNSFSSNCDSCKSCNSNECNTLHFGTDFKMTSLSNLIGLIEFHLEMTSEETICAYIVPNEGTTKQSSLK